MIGQSFQKRPHPGASLWRDEVRRRLRQLNFNFLDWTDVDERTHFSVQSIFGRGNELGKIGTCFDTARFLRLDALPNANPNPSGAQDPSKSNRGRKCVSSAFLKGTTSKGVKGIFGGKKGSVSKHGRSSRGVDSVSQYGSRMSLGSTDEIHIRDGGGGGSQDNVSMTSVNQNVTNKKSKPTPVIETGSQKAQDFQNFEHQINQRRGTVLTDPTVTDGGKTDHFAGRITL
ncbi:synaptic vesicle exocytosis [Branchiostoma belcheri]|nr:synaptic vesicle exocytosis [Branchiostoma belcheri]